ncbi:invasion associated locus B family protein [Methylosinus sp. Sm6]|uniref:invasion associated locus B family protein n=1 Tax=Methylosinus sp. Sm6 TaxID=2866948 RepID=UPI001C9945E1|nr:invasion associated locus B family protein [Methylosinus sp. Sm6]MBY6242057.1 invasion associated locus B family protein [Methylosinus sp. Sm6]
MRPSAPDRRLGWLRHLVAGVVLAGAAQAACPPAAAQGALKSRFGDWEIRCETPPGAASEQCALIQSVAAEDKANINLVVIVLKTSDGKSRLLRVIAPLNVLLIKGLGLTIDKTRIGDTGFLRCLPSGCVAEVVMDDALIEQLKSGKTATFVIYLTPDEGVGLPLSLAGFKEGFAKLP